MTSGIRLNLAGKRFGRLVVLEFAHKDSCNRSMWLCQCDCGGTKVIRGTHLTKTLKPTQSCGCIHNELLKGYKKNHLPKGEASLNTLYSSYRIRARNKKMPFTLNREDFRKLTSSDCFYCGAPPEQVKCDKGYNGGYIYNGIDRLDNGDGYIPNNAVACCGTCNNMKATLSLWEFRKRIKAIYNNFVMGLYE